MLKGRGARLSWGAVGLTVLVAVVTGCAAPPSEEEIAEQQKVLGARPMATESLKASLYDAAGAAERVGNYASAVTFYNSLHTRKPEDVRATIGLARNLRYIGAADSAVEILNKALEESPDDPVLVAEMGKAQLAAGLPEEALATLLRARELVPTNWRVHSALGIAYDRLGRYDAARLSYAGALDLSPNNVIVLNNLALSHVQTEELDRGIELLKRAAARPKATVQVRQNLALLYALKGNIEEAEKLARQDLPEKIVRTNVEYYRRLGESRLRDEVSAVRPASTTPAPGTGVVPIRLELWEEDTETERVGAAVKDAKKD